MRCPTPLAAQAGPLASPGVYYGTGNINNGFTITNIPSGGGTIELGLSAIKRFVGPIAPSGSTYFVLTGDTTVQGKPVLIGASPSQSVSARVA